MKKVFELINRLVLIVYPTCEKYPRLFVITTLLLSISVTDIWSQNLNLDRPPSDSEVRYSPDNDESSATNPPAFIWLPVEGVDAYNVQYSQSDIFDQARTVTIREIDMTVFIPTEVIEPGIWYWRYGYSRNGEDHFSRARRFEVPDDATIFPLVTADEFIGKIPEHRPRLYFSPELVKELRSDSEGIYDHLTAEVIWNAEEILAMNEPLFKEPDPWPEDNYRPIYYKAWRSMRPYTQRMVTSALAYLYTGDQRFADEAKRRLMHFMTWNIEGSSSAMWPTELGMDIIENTTPVFDWIYDTLSDRERSICIDVLSKRFVQINRDVHRERPMESNPYSSHPGRMVGFALEGGIVLAHESPDAKDWIDYTLKLVWSTYPAWGGAEGGWHEGVSYWIDYMRRIVRVVHELDFYDIPLKNKPFFQNTGYFGLYAAYPGRPTRAFGDEHHLRLGSTPGTVTYMLSNLYNNPYLRWHADTIGSGPSGRKAVRIYNPDLDAKPPFDLPQSRVFNDVGIVAMHSEMADPQNNIMMLFKSNPFGAISHNHASQNAFVIEAFGEPLTISSGYRQTHRTPHHTEWIWQTKAHNSILVDNEGQVPRQRSSQGEIIEYQEHGNYVYSVGDATKAYDGRLDRFHRHILFIRPDYFVIIDDLKTSGSPSTYQWLFHTANEMIVDDEHHVVMSTSGDARLLLRFLTPDNLEFIQKTGFDPPVEDPATAPDQFHLTASTVEPAAAQNFVTVIWIDRDEKPKTSGVHNIEHTNMENANMEVEARIKTESDSVTETESDTKTNTKTDSDTSVTDTVSKTQTFTQTDTNSKAEADSKNVIITENNSLVRLIVNKGFQDKEVRDQVVGNAEWIDAVGGIALRVGYDLILWKYEETRIITAAGISSENRVDVLQGYFSDR